MAIAGISVSAVSIAAGAVIPGTISVSGISAVSIFPSRTISISRVISVSGAAVLSLVFSGVSSFQQKLGFSSAVRFKDQLLSGHCGDPFHPEGDVLRGGRLEHAQLQLFPAVKQAVSRSVSSQENAEPAGIL